MAACLLLLVSLGAFPQQLRATSTGHTFPYRFDMGTSLTIAALGLGLSTAALVLDELVPYPTAAQMGEGGLDRHDVPGVDRAFMHDFDYELQNLGHVLLTATMLMPLASVAGGDVADAVRIGALFGQTMLLSYGSKGALVHVFPRHRPHTYFHGTPRACIRRAGTGIWLG